MTDGKFPEKRIAEPQFLKKADWLSTRNPVNGALDWTLFSPELVLDLPAGVQTVSMECISGALSLDAFSFIRCEEMEALKR